MVNRRRKKRRTTAEMRHLVRETDARLERNKETQERLRDRISETRERIREVVSEGKDLDPKACDRLVASLESEIADLREKENEARKEREEILAEGHELLEDIEKGLDANAADASTFQSLEGALHGGEIKRTVAQVVRSCEARTKIFKGLARDARRALEQ